MLWLSDVDGRGRESWCGAIAVDDGENWLAAGCGDGSVSLFHVGTRSRTSRSMVPASDGGSAVSVTALQFHSGQVSTVLAPCGRLYWGVCVAPCMLGIFDAGLSADCRRGTVVVANVSKSAWRENTVDCVRYTDMLRLCGLQRCWS